MKAYCQENVQAYLDYPNFLYYEVLARRELSNPEMYVGAHHLVANFNNSDIDVSLDHRLAIAVLEEQEEIKRKRCQTARGNLKVTSEDVYSVV